MEDLALKLLEELQNISMTLGKVDSNIEGLRRDLERVEGINKALGEDVDKYRTEVHDLKIEVKNMHVAFRIIWTAIGTFTVTFLWILDRAGVLARIFSN